MEVAMANKKTENEPVEIPLELVPETPQETEALAHSTGENIVENDVIQVNQGNVAQVNAEKVEFRQGGAARVNADQVTIHQGGAGMIQAITANVDQGGVGILRANEATLTNSSAQLMAAQAVTVNGGMAGVLVANEVHANPLRAVIVLAQKIDGPVETSLDTRGAMLAGLVGGVALGLISLVGRLLIRNHKS
jgi:hypothetical protein